MRKKKASNTHTSQRSLRILFVFCSIVFLLIAASLFIKFISVVKNSKFDGQHRFTLLITHQSNQAELLSFEPLTKSITRVSIQSTQTLPDIGKHFAVAIDGKVTDKNGVITNDGIARRLFKYSTGISDSSLTAYDFFRLFLFTQERNSSDIESKHITDISDTEKIDKELAELFQDSALQDEKVPIAIINASGVSGRGTALERVLVNMGANVVQVKTAPKDEIRSVITYVDKDSYTTQKIRNLLGFQANKSEGDGLSDIIIVIGKENITHPVF